MQLVVPLAGDTRAVPQAPQWSGLVRVSTSQPLPGAPSQSSKPVLHARPQRPVSQRAAALAPAGHTLPQVPQWDRLVRVSVSQPLAGLPSQLLKPAVQPAMPHTPALQEGVPLGTAQTRPQAPQWRTSSASTVSQPLASMPSQSPRPMVQLATPHIPARQVGVAPEAVHATPQRPQWAGLTRTSVSQPLSGLLSQSPNPSAHC